MVELMVIVALVAFFAVTISPSLSAQKAGRDRREFYRSLTRLAARARETAIEQKQTYAFVYDEASRQFQISVDSEIDERLKTLLEQSSSGSTSSTGITRSGSTITSNQPVLGSVTIPTKIDAEEFRLSGQTVSSADWKICFYPDGRADAGSVTMNDSGSEETMQVSSRGSVGVLDGLPSDPTSDKWTAGDYEKRG